MTTAETAHTALEAQQTFVESCRPDDAISHWHLPEWQSLVVYQHQLWEHQQLLGCESQQAVSC
jgi:hypothetical protein